MSARFSLLSPLDIMLTILKNTAQELSCATSRFQHCVMAMVFVLDSTFEVRLLQERPPFLDARLQSTRLSSQG